MTIQARRINHVLDSAFASGAKSIPPELIGKLLAKAPSLKQRAERKAFGELLGEEAKSLAQINARRLTKENEELRQASKRRAEDMRRLEDKVGCLKFYRIETGSLMIENADSVNHRYKSLSGIAIHLPDCSLDCDSMLLRSNATHYTSFVIPETTGQIRISFGSASKTVKLEPSLAKDFTFEKQAGPLKFWVSKKGSVIVLEIKNTSSCEMEITDLNAYFGFDSIRVAYAGPINNLFKPGAIVLTKILDQETSRLVDVVSFSFTHRITDDFNSFPERGKIVFAGDKDRVKN